MKTVYDLLVLRVAESGIQKYWELQVKNRSRMKWTFQRIICIYLHFLIQSVANHANSKIQLGISISRHREKTGLISLSLDHVSGAFLLLGMGLFTATCIFILEFIYYRCSNRKKSSIIHVEPYESPEFF